MKRFFIAALALAIGAFAGAEEVAKLTLETLNGTTIHELALQPVEEVKTQLEAIRDAVVNRGTVANKGDFALVVTAIYARENPGQTYAQLLEKLKENRAAIGVPADVKLTDWYRVVICNVWYTGYKNLQVYKDCLEATKDVTEISACWEYAQAANFIYGLEAAAPWYLKAGAGGKSELARQYVAAGEIDKAASIFWEALTHEGLNAEGRAIFPQMLAYELEQPDFDAAALKSKLNKAILIYKSKARQWKPTKEGEANPFVEFVGMLQDTAKDL